MNFVARQCIVRVRGTGCGAARWTRHRRRRSRTAGRRRRRRAPADHTQARHGKAASGRTGPASSKPQPMSELRNHPRKLTPNSATFTRTGQFLSRPVEDCAECPALAGVRNLGLDDPIPGRPDSPCNFGDRFRRSLANHAEYGTRNREIEKFGTYSGGAVAQGHHAVLLSMTSSRTSTTVSPPALSRRPTANGLSTPARYRSR